MPEALAAAWPFAIPVLKALATLVVGFFFAGKAEKWVVAGLERGNVDKALHGFLGGMVKYTVIAATIIATLGAFGIKTTSVVAVFASAGLAVGLALQGTLAHFASGVMILFFRPFTIGDRIQAGGFLGDVEEIGIFVTKLRLPDRTVIIVPNGEIMSGAILNHTDGANLRGTVEIGVGYGEDLDKVRQLLAEAAASSEYVLAEPGVVVWHAGFGASSVDFQVHCWCVQKDYLDMLDDVRQRFYDTLNAANVEIPFNQLVLHKAEA